MELKPDSHLGLWYERFFDGYPEEDWDWDRDDASRKAWAKAKTGWVTKAAQHKAEGDACLYAAKRLHDLCATLRGQSRIFTGTWHFATGMGLPHPVENGFLWHPTLGLPYIPGAAVKGLVRAYIECWAEFEDQSERLDILYRWFGSEAKDSETRQQVRQNGFVPPSRNPQLKLDSEAGAFIFFDALPVSPPRLKADIMTPHMGAWYEKGGEPSQKPKEQAERTPADWHDPNPITFLVADKPSFQFSIAPRYPDARQELSRVMEALEQALEWLGAGAKTAVGYGQFEDRKEQLPDPQPRHPWLIEQIPALMQRNHEPKSENIWGGKALAEAWSSIDNTEIQTAVLKEIRSYWEAKGWWDDTPQGIKRKAKAIYVSASNPA